MRSALLLSAAWLLTFASAATLQPRRQAEDEYYADSYEVDYSGEDYYAAEDYTDPYAGGSIDDTQDIIYEDSGDTTTDYTEDESGADLSYTDDTSTDSSAEDSESDSSASAAEDSSVSDEGGADSSDADSVTTDSLWQLAEELYAKDPSQFQSIGDLLEAACKALNLPECSPSDPVDKLLAELGVSGAAPAVLPCAPGTVMLMQASLRQQLKLDEGKYCLPVPAGRLNKKFKLGA